MDDQFAGRTDDDLFSDDFQPVPKELSYSVPLSHHPPYGAPRHAPQLSADVDSQHHDVPVGDLDQPGNPLTAATTASPGDTTVPDEASSSSYEAPPSSYEAPSSSAVAPLQNQGVRRPAVVKTLMDSRHAPRNRELDAREQATGDGKALHQDGQRPSSPATAANTAATSAPTAAAAAAAATSAIPVPASYRPGRGMAAGSRRVNAARLASGGIPRAKLSEKELAAKMNRMQIVNEERERRYQVTTQDAKAHADALALGLEKARRRREESAERRQRAEEARRALESERDRNRACKLAAMSRKPGGWDSGKEEPNLQQRQEQRQLPLPQGAPKGPQYPSRPARRRHRGGARGRGRKPDSDNPAVSHLPPLAAMDGAHHPSTPYQDSLPNPPADVSPSRPVSTDAPPLAPPARDLSPPRPLGRWDEEVAFEEEARTAAKSQAT